MYMMDSNQQASPDKKTNFYLPSMMLDTSLKNFFFHSGKIQFIISSNPQHTAG
jgi:hypothetical protein